MMVAPMSRPKNNKLRTIAPYIAKCSFSDKVHGLAVGLTGRRQGKRLPVVVRQGSDADGGGCRK